MSNIYSTKSLQAAAFHIDPGMAERFGFERWSITTQDSCVNPNTLTFDAYQRQAHPYSLTRTQGGSCSAYDPATNLQAWINRENSVDRPYIEADLTSRRRYDTMGAGRDMQASQSGWYRVNMQKDTRQCCDTRPAVNFSLDPRMSKNLSIAATRVYNA